MGRKKKFASLAFPSLPIPFIDAMLYAEDDIRRAVKDARETFSFIGSGMGKSGGARNVKQDRTAGAALKLAEELPAVVLDDGRTVKRPETWLKVFDAVRAKAKQCTRPEWIMTEWEIEWKGKDHLVGYDPDTGRKMKSWVRYNVAVEARAAGTVSFSDDEIIEGVSAAEFEQVDE